MYKLTVKTMERVLPTKGKESTKEDNVESDEGSPYGDDYIEEKSDGGGPYGDGYTEDGDSSKQKEIDNEDPDNNQDKKP